MKDKPTNQQVDGHGWSQGSYTSNKADAQKGKVEKMSIKDRCTYIYIYIYIYIYYMIDCMLLKR